MSEIADLMKEYFASKEKLSVVIAKQEEYAQRMMDEGFSPRQNLLNRNVIELLQSIDDTVSELLEDTEKPDPCLMIESLLHIGSCVSGIRVKLGLPPTSFAKQV